MSASSTNALDEKQVIEWLGTLAADSGLGAVRLVIENREKYPCAVYAELPDDRLVCGLGQTFDEAFKQITEKIAARKRK